jgi:D-alanyl-D-alanine carboxypeptidase (penicillin-binding protein 5/6)
MWAALKEQKWDFWVLAGLTFFGVLWGLTLVVFVKPAPNLTATLNDVKYGTESKINFDWPKDGVAAIGTVDTGLKEIHGADTPRPTASMAKVITALVVLEKKPISTTETGDKITITPEMADFYNKIKDGDQSRLEVKVGEVYTERDLLNGMMLVSANNLADTVAVWAYGSKDDYLKAANKWLADHNLADTKMVDASGFDPGTVSTPRDMISIGTLAYQNETLRGIFRQVSAPFNGQQISNTNQLLGIDKVFGLKTGHTDQAGANLLWVSSIRIDNVEKVIVGVVMGQNDADLFNVAKKLNKSAQDNLGNITLVPAGTVVGKIQSSWGESSNITTEKALNFVGWRDEVYDIHTEVTFSGNQLAAGSKIGKLTTNAGSVDLVAPTTIGNPGMKWRLMHPF